MRWRWYVMLGVLAAAAALVVVLSRANSELTREVRRLRGQLILPQRGDVLPPLEVGGVGDERIMLAGGHPQLLFVFNTTCGYCVATLPQWDALWRRFRRHPAVQVLGVSLHDDSLTQGYIRQHGIPYPVVRFPDERLMRMYRAMGVPLTLLLDTVGTVRYVRAGALSETAVDSLLTEMRNTGLVLDVVSP